MWLRRKVFFKKEEKVKSKPLEKAKVISELKNKSTREAKAFLESQASVQSKDLDRLRDLSSSRVEIKFSVSDENFKKIDELKNRFSKAGEDLSFEDLFLRLYDEVAKIKSGQGNRKLLALAKLFYNFEKVIIIPAGYFSPHSYAVFTFI